MFHPTRSTRAFAALPLRIGAVATALALVAGLAVVVAPVAADAGATRYVSPSAMSAVLASAVVHRPDGRIRLAGGTGVSGGPGPYVGNDVYNTTGAHQTISMHYFNSLPRDYLTFGISIQNDGTSADRFKVKVSGNATNGWKVRYFRGTTDITSAVVAGTYRTSSLAPGCPSCLTATYDITAKVTWVGPYAAAGIARLLTISSAADGTKNDAVKFVLVLDHP